MSVSGCRHGNILSVIDTPENRSVSRNDYCVWGRGTCIIAINGSNEKVAGWNRVGRRSNLAQVIIKNILKILCYYNALPSLEELCNALSWPVWLSWREKIRQWPGGNYFSALARYFYPEYCFMPFPPLWFNKNPALSSSFSVNVPMEGLLRNF